MENGYPKKKYLYIYIYGYNVHKIYVQMMEKEAIQLTFKSMVHKNGSKIGLSELSVKNRWKKLWKKPRPSGSFQYFIITFPKILPTKPLDGDGTPGLVIVYCFHVMVFMMIFNG